MARTDPMQAGIESVMRSPRLDGGFLPNRGSPATAGAMHSGAERTNGCMAAFFCCVVICVPKACGSRAGPVAMLMTSAAPASGARSIRSSPNPAELNHLATTKQISRQDEAWNVSHRSAGNHRSDKALRILGFGRRRNDEANKIAERVVRAHPRTPLVRAAFN